jgi:hypothetical protein
VKAVEISGKEGEYLKSISELEINIKNKIVRELYRGVKEFKNCYQSRTNIVKDENGNLFTYSHSIRNR